MKSEVQRVLYVDDDDLCRKSLIRCLKKMDIHLDVAQDLKTAIKLCEKNEYCIVLTDYSIPGCNGIEVIENILPLQPTSVYMLTTGDPYLELPQKNEAASRIFDVIAKPWGFKEIRLAIEQAIEYFIKTYTLSNEIKNGSSDYYELLLIEDDLNDEFLTKYYLSKCIYPQFKIESVGRVSDAIAKLSKKKFHAVLVDLSLPDARGVSAIRELRMNAQDTPLVVISGTDDEFLIHQSIRTGANSFIAKEKLDDQLLSSMLLMLLNPSEKQSVQDKFVSNFH